MAIFREMDQQKRNYFVKGSLSALSLSVVYISPFFLLIFMIPDAQALSCYETVNGKTTIKQNDTWQFCSIVPAILHRHDLINGTQFGLGSVNDGLAAYQAAFGLSEKQYRILTVCIYERYDFSRFLGFKQDTAVEFAFRCVCNYDLCNSEATFHAYLKVLREESYVVKG